MGEKIRFPEMIYHLRKVNNIALSKTIIAAVTVKYLLDFAHFLTDVTSFILFSFSHLNVVIQLHHATLRPKQGILVFIILYSQVGVPAGLVLGNLAKGQVKSF